MLPIFVRCSNSKSKLNVVLRIILPAHEEVARGANPTQRVALLSCSPTLSDACSAQHFFGCRRFSRFIQRFISITTVFRSSHKVHNVKLIIVYAVLNTRRSQGEAKSETRTTG